MHRSRDNEHPGTGSQDLRLAGELFVIPDGERYLLYAPHRKAIAAANAGTVNALQTFARTGEGLDNDIVGPLVDAGILVDSATRSADPIVFPRRSGEFDPLGLSLFLTTRCSMACTYCYANGGSVAKVMSRDIARSAIDWIVRHTRAQSRDAFYLMFHGGGEVTTAKNLFKQSVGYARKRAAEHGLKPRIEAGLNGVMDEATCEWISEQLDGATVSVDGLPEIHNAHRPLRGGNDSFELVARTLRKFDELGFNYGIRVTVLPEALDRLPESIDYLARHFRVRSIQTEPVFSVGRAVNLATGTIDPQQFVERFREAARLAASHGSQLKYSGARFNTLGNQFCKVSADSFNVTTDGLLTSCFEVAEADDARAPTFIYGRFDQQAGTPVLDMDKVNRLRMLTVENKPNCSDCFCKWHCAGDCSAKQAVAGNAWDSSLNPRCHINRELTRDQMRAYLDEETP